MCVYFQIVREDTAVYVRNCIQTRSFIPVYSEKGVLYVI